jgi:nitroimidazol reductase NimA-like FMN-containing flavoprotein (pyridoxamine 5'-phosphate oxidase superfamily)
VSPDRAESAHLVELAEDECLRLLATERVGRVAVSMPSDSPLVVPVNYTLTGDSILFRSGFGTKLRALASRPISFEIDGHDVATRTGWSVLVRGRAREIHSRDAEAPLPDPWLDDERPYLVRLQIRQLTGRRIERPA